MGIKSTFVAVLLACSPQAWADGLYVCNESGEDLSVAFARYENNLWISNGWTSVRNQNCTQLTEKFTNTRYYLYAVGSSGKIWQGNHRFCINEFAGFSIPYADNTAACTARNFFSVWVPDMITGSFPERYAVVIGPDNTGLNHPRAER